MNIGILWKSGSSEGWIDTFSISDFKKDCINELYIHPVISKGEKSTFAACIKTVQGSHVCLDYRPFPITNEHEDILLGIVEFKIDVKKNKISKFTWQEINSSIIEGVDYQQTSPSRKPKIPQRIYNLLACEDIDKENPFFDQVNNAFSQIPNKVSVNTSVFVRNPIVVKEALNRAKGICQKCGNNAPFISKVTNEPYLEVHHIIPLSEKGADNLHNVIAICPNCHREAHFGSA